MNIYACFCDVGHRADGVYVAKSKKLKGWGIVFCKRDFEITKDLKLAAAAAAFTGAALLTVNWYFYSKGYHAAESKLMQEMADLRAANGIIIREQEQKYLAERDRITAEYQTTIEGLKAAHDKEIIDLNRLRDTVRVPECVPVPADKSGAGVPAKAADRSSVKCYTDAELSRKIKSSLDIAAECDELAVKYGALLRWCKVQ